MMGESVEIKVTRGEDRLDEHDHQIKELQKNVKAMNNLSQSSSYRCVMNTDPYSIHSS